MMEKRVIIYLRSAATAHEFVRCPIAKLKCAVIPLSVLSTILYILAADRVA
jgi:hypothetical protein